MDNLNSHEPEDEIFDFDCSDEALESAAGSENDALGTISLERIRESYCCKQC